MIWSITVFAESSRPFRSCFELAANALVASMRLRQMDAIDFFISNPFDYAPTRVRNCKLPRLERPFSADVALTCAGLPNQSTALLCGRSGRKTRLRAV